MAAVCHPNSSPSPSPSRTTTPTPTSTSTSTTSTLISTLPTHTLTHAHAHTRTHTRSPTSQSQPQPQTFARRSPPAHAHSSSTAATVTPAAVAAVPSLGPDSIPLTTTAAGALTRTVSGPIPHFASLTARPGTISADSRLSSPPRPHKSPSLLSVAIATLDRSITNRAESLTRNLQSAATFDRLSLALESPAISEPAVSDRSSKGRVLTRGSSASSNPTLLSLVTDTRRASQVSLKDPISTPYSKTDASQPLPILRSSPASKMHQTSSRLLRMTDDDRPFTRDFKDLFSTLIVSLLPLSSHRVRLTRVEHTFLSEDAINNLGSLKFSQSNRMPDPKDPTRIVTTTTTTTFSMAKDMARSICQRFLDARFIESADGKLQPVYTMKGAVWQLTPKGVCVLDRFCSRNGIQQRQIGDLVALGSSHLCILERDPATDKLVMDRGTMEVVFRRLCGGQLGLNIKSNVNTADSDSLSDYRDGYTGVKMASERKLNGKVYKDTFTGKGCSDWLMDCCTTVDRRETYEMASLFVEYDLMVSIQQDRAYIATSSSAAIFQPTKNAIYQLTPRGKEILSGIGRGRTSESDGVGTSGRPGVARDSNTQRLDKILNDAALRLLFRENLRETHCEENLSFYIEVDQFVRGCRGAIKSAQRNPSSTSMDSIKEIMAQAYGIYNAFLAPGSPCELNIDHQLRSNLATRMTKAVGQDVAMIETLQEVIGLFEGAQNAVFKLMASDSVPKFLRNAKYEHTLKNYDFDSIATSGQPNSFLHHYRKTGKMFSKIMTVGLFAAGAFAQGSAPMMTGTGVQAVAATAASSMSMVLTTAAANNNVAAANGTVWQYYSTDVTSVTVVNQFTTMVAEATTLTYNDCEYPATKGEVVTVTDCPCTITTTYPTMTSSLCSSYHPVTAITAAPTSMGYPPKPQPTMTRSVYQVGAAAPAAAGALGNVVGFVVAAAAVVLGL
ncbi:regulator of G protein signaling domain-containing protein [Nemania sp. FL0916]|nr:regulator of G protein signaling domain-containing protein [Nemania sp. FL0916]